MFFRPLIAVYFLWKTESGFSLFALLNGDRNLMLHLYWNAIRRIRCWPYIQLHHENTKERDKQSRCFTANWQESPEGTSSGIRA